MSEFFHEVEKFTSPREGEQNRFLYRGLPDTAFRLLPSLARLAGPSRPWLKISMLYHIERMAKQQFEAKLHLYSPGRFPKGEPGSLEIWQVMQHHGAKTRLLDWTASAYVALYFAVSEMPERDGAVYMVDLGAHADRMKERFPEQRSRNTIGLWSTHDLSGGISGAKPIASETDESMKDHMNLFFTPCLAPDSRMAVQRGWFSCAARVETDHGEAIAKAFEERPCRWCRKFEILASAKSRILRELWHMNFTGEILFPGLDGLGRAMAELADLIQPEPSKFVEYLIENGLLQANDLHNRKPSAFADNLKPLVKLKLRGPRKSKTRMRSGKPKKA